ncbi:MAG: PA2169 family four-helix-bundle protein [Christiangramia sp.]|uniref:ferritin-like domain-containing protein n=1 Tax=Christiangramia sp. TaxID=1931228 RepID=UPI003241D071
MKTTREAAREASHDALVHDLKELLERNYDAEKGYKKAMEHTSNDHLKRFLKSQAARRNHFATEIDNKLHALNEHHISDGGSVLGNLHRFWLEFRSSLSKHDDESLLEECIRGEKSSVRIYEKKLKDHTFPTDIRLMLEKQLETIRNVLKEVKILEDLED